MKQLYRLMMLGVVYLWILRLVNPSDLFAQEDDIGQEISVLDYSIDLNQDGLPDQLVEAVEHLTLQARTRSQAAQRQARDDFVARLPYAAQTRSLQTQIGQLGQQLLDENGEAKDLSPEAYVTLEAEMKALQAQIERSDPNYALTLRTIETMAWNQLQDRIVPRRANAVAGEIDFDDLKRGDLMFSNSNDFLSNFTYAMNWSHVATHDGGRWVYEATKVDEPKGVRRATYDSWQEDGNRLAFGRNNERSQYEVEGALNWAKNKWGTNGSTPYNNILINTWTETSLYCSQLVWKIHRHISSDLRYGGDDEIYYLYIRAAWDRGIETIARLTIPPDVIALDDNVTLYAVGVYGSEPRAYLPDVRTNGYQRWDSTIIVRNDTSGDIDVRVVYFDNTGKPYTSQAKTNLAANAIWQPLTNLLNHAAHAGSAIVYATGEVSVMTYLKRDTVTQDIYGAYTGISQPSTQVHVPLVQRGNSRRRIDSILSIQNTGEVTTEAVVTYKAGHTDTSCTKSYRIPPFGLASVKMTEAGCSPYRFGSAYITAGQPVAVTATQLPTANNKWFMIWSSAAGSARTIHAPLIQNGNANIQAGLMLQTASGNSNNLTVNYYRKDATACGNNTYNGIKAFYAQQVYPAPPAGNTCSLVSSAKFSGSQNMAAIVNQVKGNQAAVYSAIAQPGEKVIMPLWMYRHNGWSSGLVVRNTASRNTDVTINFYDNLGNKSIHTYTKNLKPSEIYVLWKKPSTNRGSAVVTANKKVAVMVNHLYEGTAATTDPLMSHVGVHR